MLAAGKLDIQLYARPLLLRAFAINIYTDTFYCRGDTFSIDPLELTVLQNVTENGQQWTICVNSFQPQLDVGAGDLDYLLGDIFMRNVYTV